MKIKQFVPQGVRVPGTARPWIGQWSEAPHRDEVIAEVHQRGVRRDVPGDVRQPVEPTLVRLPRRLRTVVSDGGGGTDGRRCCGQPEHYGSEDQS